MSNASQPTAHATTRGAAAGAAVAAGAGSTAQADHGQRTAVFDALPDPHAFVRIGADGGVTVISKHLEMGQGIHTGLATLVAEELDAAWAQIRVEPAPVDPSRYGNPMMGGGMGTGGQTSIQASWMAMRKAGAAMRAMLAAAAAARWGVAPEEVAVSGGVLSHAASGRSARFGDFAADVAAMPAPESVTLKDPRAFTYIGKSFPRLDSRAKARGETVFTQDLALPGMLVAMVERPRRPGAKVRGFEAAAARAVPGVRQVVEVPTGVAVVGEDVWSVLRGRAALTVEWDEAEAATHDSDGIRDAFRALARTPGAVALDAGDAEAALAGAARRIVAEYEVPYHAHATMEPMDCVIRLGPDLCEIWGGPQMQMIDQPFLARALGLPAERIRLHMLEVGGSFGRRAHPHAMPYLEAAAIAKAVGGEAPIKVLWSRGDDLASAYSYFRPGFVHRIEIGLDAGGRIVAWRQRAVGQSILTGTVMAGFLVRDGIDQLSLEGTVDSAYRVPNRRVELHTPELPIRASWLRSSGTFHNLFAAESAVDECARATGEDPVAYRRAMLGNDARELGALDLAAGKAGWGAPLAPGKAGELRGRGVAVGPAHHSYASAVAEVTVGTDGRIRVDRVVVALDCGLVVNPDNARAQVEGSVGFALSLAMCGRITFRDGAVEQSSYRDYGVLRFDEMPAVETHFVPSSEGPSGTSETVVALVAPAVANAIADATGRRLRTLPLRLG